MSAKIEALRARPMAQPRLDLLAHARRMGDAGRPSPSPTIGPHLTATDGRTRLGASHTLPPVRPRSSGDGAPPTILQPWKLGPTRPQLTRTFIEERRQVQRELYFMQDLTRRARCISCIF
jgi:hypothetical protein